MRTFKNNAFTIIELLAVIAIIAILSSILIPAANGVIRQSRIATSKARLWQYINALENFKAEYNYYPQVYRDGGNGNGRIDLFNVNGSNDSVPFIEALSGKDHDDGDPKSVGGNFRMIEFYSFSEKEFIDSDADTDRLSDPFNNFYIYIMIDVDGDGIIRPYSSNPRSPGEIKGSATAWVSPPADSDLPGYALWE